MHNHTYQKDKSHLGLKIKIFSPGKTKEPWLQRALAEYEKRLTGAVAIEWDQQNLPMKGHFICLDPNGIQSTSPDFSGFLHREFEKQGSRLTFVIGGPTGLPLNILKKASHSISLSKMTFTHQHTRLLLLEQIYRAFQIRKGTYYHK